VSEGARVEASKQGASPMTLERARTITRVVRVLSIFALVGLGLAAITARVLWAGENEIAESTAALKRGDAQEATVRARRAAGWYAPGAPHVRVAYGRLISIATTAEGLGDRELALLAWRGVRTAALETRWFVTPHEADLDRANHAIARIEAAAPRPPGTRTEPTARIEDKQLAALLRDEAPRMPWVVALLGGLVAWVAGAAWAIRRATDSLDKLDLKSARPALLLAVSGVLVWILALWRA